MRSIIDSLSRGTTALVVDHHTVHHAANTVSIHFEEKDTKGQTIRGQDVDGVTVDDLGSTGEISKVINDTVIVKFISAISGLPTLIAVNPPAPKAEEAKTADGGEATSAP